MPNSTRIPSVAKIAAKLEAMMDACRPFRDAEDDKDVRLAFGSLLLACHDALDALGAIGGRANLEDMAAASAMASMDALRDRLALAVPPVSGGAPDDFEAVDPAVFSDEWPAYRAADLDGYAWAPTFDGPTPDDVLAASAPTWEPSDADWDDAYAMAVGETYSPGTLDEMVLRGYGHLAAR